MKTKKDIRY